MLLVSGKVARGVCAPGHRAAGLGCSFVWHGSGRRWGPCLQGASGEVGVDVSAFRVCNSARYACVQGCVQECTGGCICQSGHRESARCDSGIPAWVADRTPTSAEWV